MDLLEKIRDAGVIGAGGAGFPTYAKLNTKAEYLLLNAAECEPLLRVDQQILEFYPADVIRGFLIAKEITCANQAFIGIKEKHQNVIQILKQTIHELNVSDQLSVRNLPDVYPAGDEQVLVYELTGRVVPETNIPIAVGCVVVNVETAYNIYHAVKEEPVTMKYMTIAGAVPHPMTVRVPVGTPLAEIFKMAGREEMSGYEVIDGGPMMGPLLEDYGGYVTKKTKGLIVLPGQHGLIQKKSMPMSQVKHRNRSACEQCRMCTDLCPRHMLGHSTSPHKMVRAMAYGMDADEHVTAALTCCQCNLCEYFSCPAGISPKMANVYYMKLLKEKGIRHTPKQTFQPDIMREFRMIPSKRLIARLNIAKYDLAAPLEQEPVLGSQLFGINLKDHVGAAASPVVEVGEHVEKGQKIADVEKKDLGVPVHASVAGVVEAIDNNRIMIRRD